MFRTAKCSYSGILVYAVLYFFMLKFLRMNVWLFEICRRKCNWIKSLIKKGHILLVLITYVYHIAHFRKRTALYVCLSFCSSVHPHGKTLLQLDKFSLNLCLSIFRRSAKKIQLSLKSEKEGYFTGTPVYVFDRISLSFS